MRRPGRRWVVRNLGLGGFAVAVLAACSRGSDAGADAGTTSGTPAGGAPPSAGGSGTAASGAATAAGPEETGRLGWDRVDLGFVSAYVLVRGKQATVVDTGVAGSADAIGAVLAQAGPGWEGVRHVILTHHHGDHAGSIGDVLDRATAAVGHIGAADLEQVSAPRALQPLADGDEVFGLRMVATPGHTAGHMSVFDPDTGVLVAGDAINNTAGLSGPNPQFTADLVTATASVKLLAALPVRTVLFGHGAPLESGAAAALQALAAR